ncbi:non-structural maintenance of chromosomes element 3 homolog isoform X3 [Haemorhous mexicanus]|uniref:non-structural maintenance of chromosomes element 3 homolog isoform X3 n=1 Tax=Haemorhous mexicanus TaxID=30427 RepID=UPI0028BE4F95|nr:non-structural maintenance of chromosomes element 3 homolog isoform X3 [Haemorhous mexicanus]XP_059693416.1 non-structural maintenance of chromosomes element 3 homolog isoform X3 [Haemorhous mexicanus]
MGRMILSRPRWSGTRRTSPLCAFLARSPTGFLGVLRAPGSLSVPCLFSADVLKNIIREYRNAYSEIVRRADRTLQEVFGLQLVEIDTKRHIYILINNLPRAEGQHLCRGKEKEKMALLLVILSFIFMKGNSVKDSALWEFLHLLRVHPGKQHGVFGDVRKLVTEEFVRQKYLEITPIPLTDPPEFKYQWGPRAEKETSKKDVLNFVAKMQGKDPTFWASQYSEAEADNTTT